MSVITVGSVNYDLVVMTDTVPRAGESVIGSGFFTSPGGKGANQAAAAAKSGAQSRFLGAVGNDTFGITLRESLASAGVDVSGLQTAEGSSGTAFIILSGGDNRIVAVNGANGRIDTDAAEQKFLHLSESGDILLLQFEIDMAVNVRMLAAAKERGVTTVLNCAPYRDFDKKILKDVDILVLNETETQSLTGIDPEPPSSHPLAVAAVRALDVKRFILTLGSRGGVYYDDVETVRFGAYKVTPVDTTGAGDTFIGAFAAEYGRIGSFRQAVIFASAAAAVSVTRKGAQGSIPARAETEAFIRSQPALSFSAL